MKSSALLLAVATALLVGCGRYEIPESDSPLVMRLDNFGGDEHGGRRIELHEDGTFRNEWYSDELEYDRDYNEVYTGTYAYDADQAKLTLTADGERTESSLNPELGEVETLYRVDVDGIEYWVADDDRERITQEDEDLFRNLSLQREP